MLQAVKAYAPTKSGREVARKAMTGAPAGAVLIAFKAESVDDVAREVVASSADRTTSTTKGTTSRAAMREGALDLATRIGQKGIVGGNGSAIGIDRNHRTPLDNDDVMLKAVWPGAGGIG